MVVLSNYQAFSGTHWETGSVHNYYSYRQVKAPHTGQPYSEALLLGVSGGIVMGYFSFAYQGYDPQARILTRNTFDPFNKMLERLGVVQEVRQTADPVKAEKILTETLEAGLPAIVLADMFSLPYNSLPEDQGMWAMFPILVYGLEKDTDRVLVADRADVALHTSRQELNIARAKVKKVRHRLLTLDPPQEGKLASAVQLGIWDTIRLFTEAPPKGGRHNFGFEAYRWWIDLLSKPKRRMSWEREFPRGIKMYAGLLSAYTDILHFGKRTPADRGLYATFLEEAAVVLDKPALKELAPSFQKAAQLWAALAEALLPDAIAPFGDARRLIDRRQQLFNTQGNSGLEEIRAIDRRLSELRISMEDNFPLDSAGVSAMRAEIGAGIRAIHDHEERAIHALREAMG